MILHVGVVVKQCVCEFDLGVFKPSGGQSGFNTMSNG